MRNLRATEELQVTVVADDTAQVSTSAIIFALFGMSVEELAREIRDNKDEKYDGIVTNKELAI